MSATAAAAAASKDDASKTDDATELNPAQRALQSMDTTHKSMLVLRQKVVVVGDAAVGKTALVQRFHSGGQTFPKNYVMTIGCDFCVKLVNLPAQHTGGKSVGVELYIFDTAGQSVFNQRQLAQKYWENVSSVFLVYDSGNRDSFTSMEKWLREVQSVVPHRRLPGVVAATKVDLRDVGRVAVGSDEGRAFAEQHGLTFFQSSSLTHTNVDEPFQHIALTAYQRYVQNKQRVQRML